MHLSTLFLARCWGYSYHRVLTLSVLAMAGRPNTPCHRCFHPSLYKVWRNRGKVVHAPGGARVPLWWTLSGTIPIPLQGRTCFCSCWQWSAVSPSCLSLRELPCSRSALSQPPTSRTNRSISGTGKTHLGPRQVAFDWATLAAEHP